MPLVYQHIINEQAQLMVWQLSEQESFFFEKLNYHPNIRHPQKRLQHLCARYILATRVPGVLQADLIQSASGKPIDREGRFHFSVSHSMDMVAVIVANDLSVGIDIEQVQEKIIRVRGRFLSEQEASLLIHHFKDEKTAFTAGWCIKEALFKWDGNGKVDFKTHFVIQDMEQNMDAYQVCVHILNKEHQLLSQKTVILQQHHLHWLAWIHA